jgi:hypothetical protein
VTPPASWRCCRTAARCWWSSWRRKTSPWCARRSDAIELLKTAGSAHPYPVREMLHDLDPDVRILTIGILESLRHPDVEQWLIDLLEQEEHVNVCACAIDLLYELGTERCVPVLEACRERFVHEDYLLFAIDLALGRLRGASGL